MAATVTDFKRLDPKPPTYSLVFGCDVLPAKPGGFAATVVLDSGIYSVSKLDGESGWTIDGKFLPNGLPVFFNGDGARCLMVRELADPDAVAALDAAGKAVS